MGVKTMFAYKCQNSLRGAITLLVKECKNNSNYPLCWEYIRFWSECENYHDPRFTQTEQKNCPKKTKLHRASVKVVTIIMRKTIKATS